MREDLLIIKSALDQAIENKIDEDDTIALDIRDLILELYDVIDSYDESSQGEFEI